MKLLKNILATVDFSPSSNKVIENAILFAKEFNSQVSLMHVIEDDDLSPNMKAVVEENYAEKLHEYAKKVKSEGITVNKTIIESGAPFERITQEAQNQDYNVIIAGAREASKGDSYKLGTTTEKLIRKNQIPLLVIKNSGIDHIKKIVCPVDFSDAAQRALKNAITLTEHFDAELYILNVFKPVDIFSKRFEVDNAAENRRLKATQENDFANFLDKFHLKDIKHRIEMREGNPDQEILQFIKENKIDLLLMGTTGKSNLSRILMGSTTEKVTREVPCNFITTKARDITDSFFESNLKSIESILNTARVLYKNKNYEKALEKYTMALKEYPDNIPVIMGLIETHKALGNDNKVTHFRSYAKEIVKRLWGDEYLEKFNL